MKNLLPREKALRYGIDKLNDYELIALLINTGTKNSTVLDSSIKMLFKIGGIENIINKTLEELMEIEGIGIKKALMFLSISEIYRRIEMENTYSMSIEDDNDLFNVVKPFYRNVKNGEKVIMVMMNQKNKIIKIVEMSNNKGSRTFINYNELKRQILITKPHSVSIVHNHPNDIPYASDEDKNAFEKIFFFMLANKIDLKGNYIYTTKKIINIKMF